MIVDKIQKINEALAEVKALVATLQPEFEAYIKDQTIPLSERWALFSTCPTQLHNSGPWVEHLEIGGNEIYWYDDFYIDRGTMVNMVDIVTQMIDNVEGGWTTPDYTMADINEFKEMLLARNLGSFCNDW